MALRATHLTAGLVAVAALVAGGAPASQARAASPPPPTSAIQQYVEVVPTGGGGAAVGSAPVSSVHLAPVTARRINRDAGRVAPLLKEVATSSLYGAPQHHLPALAPNVRRRGAGAAALTGRDRSALNSAVDAIGTSGGHSVALLGALLGGITLALVWAAARRRRAGR